MSRRAAPVPAALMSAAEADRFARVRKGTVRALWKAGKLSGAERRSPGRHGRALFVRPEHVLLALGF